MIRADLHMHTCYSHGKNTPSQMYRAAADKGLSVIGFSEHSPRPEGFNYRHEYRERLCRHLPDYISQVGEMKRKGAEEGREVLLGMEMDWLEGQRDFIAAACRAYDYDYLLGSVHFLGNWGFDDGDGPWADASQEDCDKRYEAYFKAWKNMIESGLFQIAAHPDLIKIYSVRKFHMWLQKPGSLSTVRDCLQALKNSGMAMEISSAGLRKPCAEIYPCPRIMKIAAEVEVPVSFASDAHCCEDIGHAFRDLAEYARSFGFMRHAIFNQGNRYFLEF